jgi:predicted nucleic acid-binding protein
LTDAVYLDTSALVKLIAIEDASADLIAYLGSRPTRVASAIAIVELGRALGRRPDVDASRAFRVLDRLVLVEADRRILERAAGLAPADLRSLEAIHLATAIEIRDSIEAFITYDARLAAATRVHGFDAIAPGSHPSGRQP